MKYFFVKQSKTAARRSMTLLLGLLLLGSCRSDLTRYAGDNASELEKVLLYYKFIRWDSQKYEAAKFLIENMKYHYSQGRIVSNDSLLEAWRAETDSIYFATVNGHTLNDFPWDSLRARQKRHRAIIEADTMPDVESDMTIKPDMKTLTFKFLIEHIDHAFKVWRESKYAQNLTFDEFKEYILPYRSVKGYGFLETGQRYDDLFGKYVHRTDSDSLLSTVTYYNRAINGLRDLNGKTHRKVLAGVYDLYSRDFHACADIASYGCNILRACGVPTVVEYNVSYREWAGRHYHCGVYNDSTDTWECFNPESSLPGDGSWSWEPTMNIHRITYGAQSDSPYFLRAEGEYVPSMMNNPCFKDVTALYKPTTTLTLPISIDDDNKLAYLASYNFNEEGIFPVTWGVIDREKKTVTFQNVLFDAIYFPIYYPSEQYQVFGEPFYVTESEGEIKVCSLPEVDDSDEHWESLLLTRKFPRKESMMKVAEELVGGRFLGANKDDFSDAVTLYEISEPPIPYFRDYTLTRKGRFQYYRFQASEEHPHANISMLEWITPSSYGYKNAIPPTPPHIFYPKDTVILREDSRLVKLLDDESWDKMKWKAEYDGKMHTAPGAYPNITLRLKTPQVITRVRFAPLNADNGIHAGDEFELYYWHNGWQHIAAAKAKYEYVIFDNVPKNKLYWLRNKTNGKEELPFVIQDGQQRFIYHDILKPSKKE